MHLTWTPKPSGVTLNVISPSRMLAIHSLFVNLWQSTYQKPWSLQACNCHACVLLLESNQLVSITFGLCTFFWMAKEAVQSLYFNWYAFLSLKGYKHGLILVKPEFGLCFVELIYGYFIYWLCVCCKKVHSLPIKPNRCPSLSTFLSWLFNKFIFQLIFYML